MVLKRNTLVFYLKANKLARSWRSHCGEVGACCAWSVRQPVLPYIDGTTVTDYPVCACVSLSGSAVEKSNFKTHLTQF